MSHRLAASLALALAASAAGTAHASAAVTAVFDRACYSSLTTADAPPANVTLTGGTPGSMFDLTLQVAGATPGTSGDADGVFDASGNATVQGLGVVGAEQPFAPSPGTPIGASIEDYATNGIVTPAQDLGTVQLSVAGLTLGIKPHDPRAARHVVAARSDWAGKPVYGFVTKPGSHKVLRRIALGTGNVCGYVTKRTGIAPAGRRSARYRLSVNAGTTLEPNALVRAFNTFGRAA